MPLNVPEASSKSRAEREQNGFLYNLVFYLMEKEMATQSSTLA